MRIGRSAGTLFAALLAGAAPGSVACTDDPGHGARTGGSPADHPAEFELVLSNVPAPAEATLRIALDRWSAIISSPVPIRVKATFVSGGPAGFSAPGLVRDFDGAPGGGTWYVSALADAIAGRDLQPHRFDMELFFRSDRKWKFRPEGDPGLGEVDFLTVAMHELAHGLGMATWVSVHDGVGSYGGDQTSVLQTFPIEDPPPDLEHLPSVYDAFLAGPGGERLTDTARFANPSRSLGRFLESDEVYFAGPKATAANGGSPPRVVGTSPSHLHPDDYFWTGPDFLMTPDAGPGLSTPDPGPVLLGILEDIGWTLTRKP